MSGVTEDYPEEIDEQLSSFDSSVSAVKVMVEKLMAMPRTELMEKLDLMSAYTLNSLFWMYLVTNGVNPREHGIKQELERIRTYMTKVKEITERRKSSRLDRGAASRFVRNALYDPEDRKRGNKTPDDRKRGKKTTDETPRRTR